MAILPRNRAVIGVQASQLVQLKIVQLLAHSTSGVMVPIRLLVKKCATYSPKASSPNDSKNSVGPARNMNTPSAIKIVTLISDKMRMPRSKPLAAEATNDSTIANATTPMTNTLAGMPAMCSKPPEMIRMPAPSEAAMPATRQNRQSASIQVPSDRWTRLPRIG